MIRVWASRLTAYSKAHPFIALLLTLAVLFTLGWITAASMMLFTDSGASESVAESQSYEGTSIDESASDFELMDQHGEAVSLSDFRGMVVVLSFLDPNCTDVCPLTAMNIQQAVEALEASEVDATAFLAINVNVEANTVADVAAATEQWGMSELPTWHFLTDDQETLREVWRAYGVEALPDPNKHAEVTHTPGVFLIDPDGVKRWYIYTPLTDEFDWDGPGLGEVLSKQIPNLLFDS